MNARDDRWTAELALLGVCLIWGCNFAVMKSALDELQPFAFNAIRLTLSVLFLGLVHYRSGGHKATLPRGSWPRILGLGLLGYFGYQALFMTGLQRTPSGNSALILSSSPVFTVLIGYVLGERLRRRAVFGLAIALAGAMVIALEKGVDLGDRQMVGNLLTLGAAVAWGSYTALNRGMAGRLPAATLAFYSTSVTLPLHWALGWSDLGPLWRLELSTAAWSAIAYAGLLGTGWGYILWNVGLRKAGASHTAGFLNLVPVVALLVGWFVLGESVGWLQIVGGAAVLGGVWSMRRKPPILDGNDVVS